MMMDRKRLMVLVGVCERDMGGFVKMCGYECNGIVTVRKFGENVKTIGLKMGFFL